MRALNQFISRFKGYLAEPRDHGPELLVSVGLMLVLAGVLVIFILWVRSQFINRKQRKAIEWARRRAEPPPADDLPTRESAPISEVPESVMEPGRPWPWVLTGVIALMLLLILVSANLVPRYTMGKSVYCGYCHTMKKAVRSWRGSTHAKVGCQACHERLGVTGIVLSQIQGLSNLSLSSVYWSRQRPLVLKSAVSPACLSCHQEIGDKTIEFRDSIRVSHREFLYSIACETCHPDTGHAGKRLKVGMMDTCVTCHVENRAGVDCGICHIAEPTWSKVRLSRYRKTPISFKTCLSCHPTEMRCNQCHKPPDSGG